MLVGLLICVEASFLLKNFNLKNASPQSLALAAIKTVVHKLLEEKLQAKKPNCLCSVRKDPAYVPCEDGGEVCDDPLGRVRAKQCDRVVAVEAEVDEGARDDLHVGQVLLVRPQLELVAAAGLQCDCLQNKRNTHFRLIWAYFNFQSLLIGTLIGVLVRRLPRMRKDMGWITGQS